MTRMRFRDGIIPRIRETEQPFTDNTLRQLSHSLSRLAHGGIICQSLRSVRGICLTTNRRRWKRRRKRGVNESCQAYARLWPPWSALRAAHIHASSTRVRVHAHVRILAVFRPLRDFALYAALLHYVPSQKTRAYIETHPRSRIPIKRRK